ncbi:protein DEK-like [Salvia splendens]|uniref:protein DEK-like n=1 Tax=Salvia splendens TaxID=180675 RepID=UPI001C271E12|nr:protein DEK-like [Salvia splendens]
MATEKERVDVGGCENQEKDAKPNDVEDEALKVDADEGDEEKGGEEGEGEAKVEEESEGGMDEEEAEGEGKGKGEDESDQGEKMEEEESEKKDENLKKRSRKDKKGEAMELESPRSERPTRERKTVERFIVGESPRASASKTLSIEKGKGTQLKDIPNVAFKLSKRKTDETLQLLHTVLFGKKSKVHTLKKNIGLFSGFVWVENEEKQRTKVKEKLEKCVRGKLLDLCDVLNITVNKTSTKKEELTTVLVDFLESPHATTDSLLADKEKKGKKRKSRGSTNKSPSSSNATAGQSKKKQKLDSKSGKMSKPSIEEEQDSDDDKSKSSQIEDDHDDDSIVGEAESGQEEHHSEEGTDDDEDELEKYMVVEKSSSKKSAKKDTEKTELKSKSVGKGSHVTPSNTGKPTKKLSSPASKKEPAAEPNRKAKTPSSKKKKDDEESEEDNEVPTKSASASKKKPSKPSDKEQGKGKGKGKGTKAAEKQPSRGEMHSVVANILKEVDFNTATLSDILRQLGEHFGVDLMHRKTEVKEIITEVIESMSDDEAEEEAGSGDETGKDGDDE